MQVPSSIGAAANPDGTGGFTNPLAHQCVREETAVVRYLQLKVAQDREHPLPRIGVEFINSIRAVAPFCFAFRTVEVVTHEQRALDWDRGRWHSRIGAPDPISAREESRALQVRKRLLNRLNAPFRAVSIYATRIGRHDSFHGAEEFIHTTCAHTDWLIRHELSLNRHI